MKDVDRFLGGFGLILSSLMLVGAIAALPELSLAQSHGAIAQSRATSQNNEITKALVQLKGSGKRWIEIDLSSQRLIAWEGAQPVYAVIISTGKSSTPTYTGVFSIQMRHRVARMQGSDYDVPDVPYTMYYDGSYAIHGAYWHNRFGTPVSHGCINVAVNHARWLYNWADVGTPIVVRP